MVRNKILRTWLMMLSVMGVLLTFNAASFSAYIEARYPQVGFIQPPAQIFEVSQEFREARQRFRDEVLHIFDAQNERLIDQVNDFLGSEDVSRSALRDFAPAAPILVADARNVAPPVVEVPVPDVGAPIIADPATQARQSAGSAANETAPVDMGVVSEIPVVSDEALTQVLAAEDRFLFVGDSLMQGVAPALRRRLCGKKRAACEDLSKPSTGLSHKSFHDWPAIVAAKFNAQPYTALFVFLGANDPWDFVDKKERIRFGTPAWEKFYCARVADIVQTARQQHAQVYWIGLPNMKPPRLAQGQQVQNKIFSEQVLGLSGVFIPTHGIVDDARTEFNRAIRLPSGRDLVTRHEDGVHFTVAGQQRIADSTLERFVRDRRAMKAIAAALAAKTVESSDVSDPKGDLSTSTPDQAKSKGEGGVAAPMPTKDQGNAQ